MSLDYERKPSIRRGGGLDQYDGIDPTIYIYVYISYIHTIHMHMCPL